MDEQHEHEQYFFDGPTAAHLATFLSAWQSPCCLCTPTVGQEIERRGGTVRTLDIDQRFADLTGYRRFDLTDPRPPDEQYGIILFDPPFFNAAPATQLAEAVRILAFGDCTRPLLVSWLVRRESALLEAFAAFGLERTGYRPGYVSVENDGKNEIEFYGNLGAEAHAALCRMATAESADAAT